MKDMHIRSAFEKLKRELSSGNAKSVVTALKDAAGAVGSRTELIRLLGINQSTYTRWINGTGHRGLAVRVKHVLTSQSKGCVASTQQFTDAQVRAVAETGVASANSLSFLIRMREAAEFDLSEQLYVQLLKEFQTHEHDTG